MVAAILLERRAISIVTQKERAHWTALTSFCPERTHELVSSMRDLNETTLPKASIGDASI